MKKNATIRVLLAEDHMVVREGLRKLLEGEPGFEVIGEAANGRQAVDMTLALRPDVVVMDIAMPELNGLEALRQIRLTLPAIKTLMLSAHSDDAYVERVMELGAAGYLIKQTSMHTLMDAIRAVTAGETFYSPVVARRYARLHRKTLNRLGLAPKAAPRRLTTREMEVLQLVAEGMANKQVAEKLDISVKTVEKHRTRLMERLDIHDTAGLTRYAISAGIIENSVQVTIL